MSSLKLWELHDQIEAVLNEHVDTETGEITERGLHGLSLLEIARDTKALNVALYILGEESEAAAVKAQADRLARRAQIHKNRAAQLRSYLREHLPEGTRLADDRVQIGWRKSEAVVIDDEGSVDDEFMVFTSRPDKARIKTALKDGKPVLGAHLEKRNNLTLK